MENFYCSIKRYTILILVIIFISSLAYGDFRIGSFNTQKLGGSGEKDLSLIKKIIVGENYSIVALQEVSSKDGVEELANQLGGGWEFLVSESENNKCNGECYAFLWNGSNNIDLEPSVPWINCPLKHPPFIAGFRNGLKLFWLINVHIYHGSSVGDRDAEIDELKKFYQKFSISSEGYTIIMGDFNRECGKIDDISIPIRCDPNTETTLQKKNIGYSSKYDHFCFNDKLSNEFDLSFKAVDAPAKYHNGDFRGYESIVSDHIPIRMDLSEKKSLIEKTKQNYKKFLKFVKSN